ncbi:MAG: dihydrodipicolinate synthase family protein [Desulfuromonadales bacterium]
MTKEQRIRGVLAPVVTPFTKDLVPDPQRFLAHCRWLLGQGSGLAVFGTNSEANSMSLDERLVLLDILLDAGIDPVRIMPGTGSCALTDAVQLTERATRAGCAGVLMLPPFYYKKVSDEGLFRFFSETVERVGDARLRIYLYHIPPVTMVGISPALVERLLIRYPGVIAGMKDSSGDWTNTRTMLDNFASSGFDVFVGSENFLLANMRHGGVGCISATANVNPAAIDRLYRTWQEADADEQQQQLDAVRRVVERATLLPSLKAVLARYRSDPAWATVRPPLVELAEEQVQALHQGLDALDFAMPGLTAGVRSTHFTKNAENGVPDLFFP